MSKAWVFDEETLRRCLTEFAQSRIPPQVKPEQTMSWLNVMEFLSSPEAAPMRVAELERQAPGTTGDPNSVIR